MTTQRLYENIREYFTRPGAKLAKTPGGACYYRDPYHGGGCAVGCLIPDGLYDPGMENLTVGAVLDRTATLRWYLGFDRETTEASFLRRAQEKHDSMHTTSVDEFVSLLDDLARYYDLKVVA